MSEPQKNICPLLAIASIGTSSGPAKCIEDRCAWFCLKYHRDGDYTSGKCALVRIVGALGNKKTAAGAVNTGGGKADTSDQTVSVSIINENWRIVK